MSQASQFGLTASDGEPVAVVEWALPDGEVPRGNVLIAHGLGEHAWRYRRLADDLNANGYAVRAMDLYGHGESGGQRGGLPHKRRMLDDVADLVDETWRVYRDEVPTILLGHSMGGLIAADFVRQGIRPVQGLVLSSPAFDNSLSLWQKMLLAVMPKIAPDFRVDNGLDPKYLCRDPAVVNAYLEDKLVHRSITARLAQYVTQTAPLVVQAASRWDTPTLLMYAGNDRLVNPAGSTAFAKRAAQAKQAVRAHCFESMYHEIFNDPERAQVIGMLLQWLDKRFKRS